jgi:hypothetical protein
MGSDEKQKRRERFLLDRFLEYQGITTTRIDTGESPDFLIDIEGRTIGIEVTELFIRSNKSKIHPPTKAHPLLQAIESNSSQIVSEARKIYFDAGNSPVRSQIVFSSRVTPDIDKKKGDQIAKLIAEQIQSMRRQDSQVASWRSREDENEEHPLSEWVIFISARRVPELRFARWFSTNNSVGMVSPLTPERLQEEIDKKAPKISAYKKRAEEIWLLIVADSTRSSQMFSVKPDFPVDSVSSPFTRTFYYGYAAEGVIDLTKKSECSAVVF